MVTLNNKAYGQQRALFAGDIHGNTDHAEWLFEVAVENDCSHIIACGDFGYWVHISSGQKFVNRIAKLAETNNIHFLWVDGNHENHDILNDLLAKHGDSEPIPTPNEWVKWIPRGCRFRIGDTNLMGYGGAWSVDWMDRTEGLSWWRGELIDPEHIAQVDDEPVDILVTHEAPMGAQLSYKDKLPQSVAQRELVSTLVEKVTPELVICGHHHTRETFTINTFGVDGDDILINETEVNVLGRDTMEMDSIAIYDL